MRGEQGSISCVVIEFETLPPMTEHPAWGLEIAKVLLDGMQTEQDRSGLKSVLRMTPNDNREFERPPLMRRGRYWDAMLELFESSAAAGAELLSIESVGGKDCGYENPILKAITGYPMAMEGKTSACAHFSPMGI